MTEFAFAHDRVLVDTAATWAYYNAHGDLENRCGCAYCRNFRAALPGLPGEVRRFLELLGLTLERPAEIMEWCREDDGRHWYTALYHIAGELREAGEQPVEIAPEVTVSFLADKGPFLEEFPEPFFQLFLDVRLPWLLDEPDD